jgi:ABC-type branched-subunit amino acid transport system ATPase component
MAGTGAVLELNKLSVAYDRSPVVRDLTLTVRSGEVVALLGANGAGKTTTLRAISGLLKHDTGAVQLGGSDLAGVTPAARGPARHRVRAVRPRALLRADRGRPDSC